MEQVFSPYRVEIIGNTGHDGSVRYTRDGKPITNFSVAVNAKAKNKDTGKWEPIPDPQNPERGYTRWFDVTVWGDCPVIRKGDQLHVKAHVRYESYYDKSTGALRVSERFEADSVEILPRRDQQQPAPRDEYDIGDLGPPLDYDGGMTPGA